MIVLFQYFICRPTDIFAPRDLFGGLREIRGCLLDDFTNETHDWDKIFSLTLHNKRTVRIRIMTRPSPGKALGFEVVEVENVLALGDLDAEPVGFRDSNPNLNLVEPGQPGDPAYH
jgi:hypothetical protein